jgi:CHAT domain-containing protein/tetratricopeptide (TPR) repeat protein
MGALLLSLLVRCGGAVRGPAVSEFDDSGLAPAQAVVEARQMLAERETHAGASALETAQALDRLVAALDRAGMTGGSEASELARRALDVKQTLLGSDDPRVADSLDLLATVLAETHAREAASLLERSLAIRTRALGRDHLDTAKSDHLLGRQYLEMQEYARAEPCVERALAVRTARLGPEHPDTIRSRILVARLLAHDRDFERATAILDDALSIAERRAHPDRLEMAEIIRAQAMCAVGRLHPDASRRVAERAAQALTLDEAALGPEHPLLAKDLVLRGESGDLARARAILERAFGPQDARLAPVLAAFSTRTASLPPDAVETSEQALRMIAEAYGADSRRAAEQRRALGITYQLADNQDAKARAVLQSAVATYEKTPKETRRELAEALSVLAMSLECIEGMAAADRVVDRTLALLIEPTDNDLLGWTAFTKAEILTELGRYAEAEPQFLRALDAFEQANGPDFPAIGSLLESLGQMYARAGNAAAAEAVLTRALEHTERTSNPQSCGVGWILRRICSLQLRTGRLAATRDSCERAVSIIENACATNVEWLSGVKVDAAKAELARGELSRALERSMEAEEASREHFVRTTELLAEGEALNLAEFRSYGLDVALSALAGADAGALPTGAAARVWDGVQRSRSLVRDEIVSRRRVAASGDPAIRRVLDDLDAARTRVARLMVQGDDTAVGPARSALAAAERALAEKSADYRWQQTRRKVGLDDVRRALPPGAALVSFVKYERLSYAPRVSTPSYVAFITRSEAQDEPIDVVPLGSAARIDALVDSWQREVSTPPTVASAPKAEARYRQAAGALREAIWDPVAGHLGPAHLVLVVPDGALNFVSFSTLPSPRGGYLVEEAAAIHEVASEKDLVADARPEGGHGLLVMGGADFDRPPGVVQSEETTTIAAVDPRLLTETNVYRSPAPSCAPFRTVRFPPLPRSLVEAEEIAASWKDRPVAIADGSVIELTRSQASEGAFKRLAPGRRVIHLASHAVRWDDCPLDGRWIGGAADPSSPAEGVPLAAVALAGANRRQDARPDQDDGILTNDEIASLDLHGVEWVVLSACETGKGGLRRNEGVFGLKRAFQVAGARTLVTSLWRVRDEDSRQWMQRLYAARAQGADTASAVRVAAQGLLASRRAAGLPTHPFSWGAFVAIGDWR